MDKAKINKVVEMVVEHLVSLPVGTELTTREATKQVYGLEGIEDMELFEIDKQVRKKVKKVGLILDDSKYNDCIVGLLFNIPFIVKRREANK